MEENQIIDLLRKAEICFWVIGYQDICHKGLVNNTDSIPGYSFQFLKVRAIFLQLLFGYNSFCGEHPQNSLQEEFGAWEWKLIFKSFWGQTALVSRWTEPQRVSLSRLCDKERNCGDQIQNCDPWVDLRMVLSECVKVVLMTVVLGYVSSTSPFGQHLICALGLSFEVFGSETSSKFRSFRGRKIYSMAA